MSHAELRTVSRNMGLALCIAGALISNGASAASANLPQALQGFWGNKCQQIDDETITVTRDEISGYEWGCTISSLKQVDKDSFAFTASCAESAQPYKLTGRLALVAGGALQYESRQGPQKSPAVKQKTLKRCKTSGMP